MAGGVFSGAKLAGMTIRESATDGSDFTNPDADYRRLFLGEDGLLHVKDSAGSVTSPYTGTGDVATDAIWDAAGDIAQGTGTNTAAILSAGTAGYFLKAGGAATAVAWAARELDYVAYTSPVNLTATTEGTANTIVTGSAVAYDGATAIVIEFGCPYLEGSIDSNTFLTLYDGSGSIGRIGLFTNPDASKVARAPIVVSTRITPSNATHTYSIRGYVSSGTNIAGAGAGGSGNYTPGYIRITRAI